MKSKDKSKSKDHLDEDKESERSAQGVSGDRVRLAIAILHDALLFTCLDIGRSPSPASTRPQRCWRRDHDRK